MSTLSEIEQRVLNASCDDYEAPHTIAGDLTRYLGYVVSEEQVRVAFLRLAELGLVQAFEHDAAAQRFQPIQASAVPAAAEPWFLSREHLTRKLRPD